MWGIIPAAGSGSRIQPLAFTKELLPVGSRLEDGTERPKAVSEYLVERMILGGVDKLCFVIAPGKSDIVEYYGRRTCAAPICYAVQPSAKGLCDAIFRAAPFIEPQEDIIVGLPDTIWYPADALRALPPGGFSFLLFPVERPELFDAVVTEPDGSVREIQVKSRNASSGRIWGAFKLTGEILNGLLELWRQRDCRDEYFGTLVNAYLEKGHRARGVGAGRVYTDVGTLDGYREAIRLIERENRDASEAKTLHGEGGEACETRTAGR
jgi:glucose-1-phosphate thymidylyltransferase